MHDTTSVLVAMSGGVDSAMTAFLLKQQGYRVTGVHFVMQKSQMGRMDAERLAAFLQIPMVIKDVTTAFQKEVVENFIGAYQQNITPNPCVLCNPGVKFHYLIQIADEMNIQMVATGHYAKIKRITDQGDTKHYLFRATDQSKDQSYFLYRLTQPMLDRIIFPLGEYEKKTIKVIAEQYKIPVNQAESQDICFFSNNESLAKFLKKQEIAATKGAIIFEDGSILGAHGGLPFYTQGQRTGLGLSGGPFYVIGKDISKNQLMVTRNREHPRLLPQEITIKHTSWIGAAPVVGMTFQCKSRYRVRSSGGIIMAIDHDQTAVVRLHEPQWAVSVGQSLVVYEHDRVVGGGIIDSFN